MQGKALVSPSSSIADVKQISSCKANGLVVQVDQASPPVLPYAVFLWNLKRILKENTTWTDERV